MAQQTSVEWLEQEINKVWKGDIMHMELPRDIYYRLVEQAKAMEKEQIIDFASEVSYGIGVTKDEMKNVAEQYYNQTYKK
jgi:hypothetical protein